MRFLYRLNEMFPSADTSLRYTLGLRYILVKQMLCQLCSLKQAVSSKEDQFHIEHWEELILEGGKLEKYVAILEEYENKYQKVK